MKRIIAVLSCIIALILCVPHVSAAEKYLNSQGESFEIVINENGNAHITEKRRYYFGGDTITRYQRRYKINDYMLTDFSIYFDDEQMNILENPDESRPEGYAAIYNQNDECYVDLYMNCLNESHCLTIEYDVLDAVVLHDECAEFRWNITSADEPTDTSDLSASIVFPFNSGSGKVEVNTLGFDNGYTQNEKTDTTNELVFYQGDLSKNTAAVVQLLMPKELFQDVKRYENEIGSINIPDQTDHSKLPFGDLTLEYVPLVLAFVIFVIYVPVSIVILIILLVINGRVVAPRKYAGITSKPTNSPEYYSSLPDNLPPAIVEKLYKIKAVYEVYEESKGKDNKVYITPIHDSSYFITVLDLTDRGIISIRQCADGFMISLNDFYAKTYDFEKPLIELIRNALDGKDEISDKDFIKYYTSLSIKDVKIFDQFCKLVDEECYNRNLAIEFTPKKRTGIKITAFSVISLILTVILYNTEIIESNLVVATLLGVPFSAAIVLLVSLCIKIFRHKFVVLTQEGEDRLALWKSFGRFIDDHSKITPQILSDPSLLRKFITYSIALNRNFTFERWVSDNNSYINSSYINDENFSVYLLLCDMIKTISKILNTTTQSSSGDYSSSGGDCGGGCGGGGGCDSGSSGGSFD